MRPLLFAVALVVGGCHPRDDASLVGICDATPRGTYARARAQPRATDNVVLVTIDGVRWQEIFGGIDPVLARQQGFGGCAWVGARHLLPNLWARFVDEGVALGAPGRGQEIHASGPRMLSLPGYFEMLGAAPGCRSNDCKRAATLLDELAGRGPVAVIASWAKLDRVVGDPGAIAISAGHGASHRIAVDAATRAILAEPVQPVPWKVDHAYRADAQTTRLALAYVRAAHPHFLHVALGDTDEAAHAGDYAGYLRALAAADAFVGDLFAALDEAGDYGPRTTVIVTADHGRGPTFIQHDRAPEASRVWLLAAGGAVKHAGLVAARERYLLSQVAPTIRALLAVPRAGDRPIRDLL